MASSTNKTLYKSVRDSKGPSSRKIQKLTVGNKVYTGDTVPDGFFETISQIKTLDENTLENSESFKNFSQDYQNILIVCAEGTPIPTISEIKAVEILNRVKPGVNDFYSITANHYINAGKAGI